MVLIKLIKTWQIIEQRKKVKATRESEQEYRQLNREIQRRCRADKEKYICNIYQEIEDHHSRNEAHDLYQKVKLLSQDFQPRNCPMENDKGEVMNDMEQILQVWRNYCTQLYADDSNIPPPDLGDIRNIEKEPEILPTEVEDAISKKTQSPGR